MNQRIEANRYHAATVLALVLALAGGGIVLLMEPDARTAVLLSLPAIAGILVVRTVLVELGVRRKPGSAAIAREARIRSWLADHFGVILTDTNDGQS